MEVLCKGFRGGVGKRLCYTESVSYIRQFKTASGATGVQVCYKKGREVVKTVHIGSASDEVSLFKLLKKAREVMDEGKTSLFDLSDFDGWFLGEYF